MKPVLSAGAVACGAVGAVAAALLLPMAFHHADAGAPASRLLPSDMAPYLVDECMQVIDPSERFSSVVPIDWHLAVDGQVRALMARIETVEVQNGVYAQAGEPTLDPEATSLVNECLDTKTFDLEAEYREPTGAERLILHDWVRRVQEPCLAARGISAPSAPYEAFLDGTQYPWGMPEMPGATFDARMEIRLACPPMPDYLRRDGIWGFGFGVTY